MKKIGIVLAGCLLSLNAVAATSSPDGAKVFFVSPADGDTIEGPVKVVFGISEMDVVPAGTDQPNSGHHHLIIDGDMPDLMQAIPKDETHKHFGAGQTETEITLAPGSHTLRLVFADKDHVPHDKPVVSEPITITVK